MKKIEILSGPLCNNPWMARLAGPAYDTWAKQPVRRERSLRDLKLWVRSCAAEHPGDVTSAQVWRGNNRNGVIHLKGFFYQIDNFSVLRTKKTDLRRRCMGNGILRSYK